MSMTQVLYYTTSKFIRNVIV